MSALLWCPLRAWYVDPVSGLAVTQNVGTLGGTVQLGDGTTAASFPTQLGPSVNLRKGMSFDGGDYLQHAGIGAVTNVTMIAFGKFSKTAGFPGIMGNILAGTVGIGMDMTAASGRVTLYSAGATQFVTGTKDIADGLIHSVIGAYSTATGVASLFVDGVLDNSAAKTASTGDGGVFYVGRGAVTDAKITGSYYNVGVYPFGFTAQQAKIMHNQLMKDLSV